MLQDDKKKKITGVRFLRILVFLVINMKTMFLQHADNLQQKLHVVNVQRTIIVTSQTRKCQTTVVI